MKIRITPHMEHIGFNAAEATSLKRAGKGPVSVDGYAPGGPLIFGNTVWNDKYQCISKC